MSLVENELILNKISRYRNNGWSELKYLWYSDLYRYVGKPRKRDYIRSFLRNIGYRYTFLMRLCTYLSHNKKNVVKKIAFRFFFELLRNVSLQAGVQIAYYSKIGSWVIFTAPNIHSGS